MMMVVKQKKKAKGKCTTLEKMLVIYVEIIAIVGATCRSAHTVFNALVSPSMLYV